MVAIKGLRIFDEDAFLHDVFQPILADLGVDSRELRPASAGRKPMAVDRAASI
jgi:hypothetical protein